MRGKRRHSRRTRSLRRITPAHAGKTRMFRRVLVGVADHPRACGENNVLCRRNIASGGSPPRMRGKPISSSVVTAVARITPAYAGKTLLFFTWVVGGADHPRVCGENMKPTTFLNRDCGSPPRMRGKLRQRQVRKRTNRITPAYAGKTSPCLGGLSYRSDHPRVCGENICNFCLRR